MMANILFISCAGTGDCDGAGDGDDDGDGPSDGDGASYGDGPGDGAVVFFFCETDLMDGCLAD